MPDLTKEYIDIIKEYIPSILKWLKNVAWKYIACPFIKTCLPKKCRKTGLVQSRMRYYFIWVQPRNSPKYNVYQEIYSSDGVTKRYVDVEGKEVFLPEVHEAGRLDGQFKCPSWRKMDWKDIFNGDKKSGCWAFETA